MADTVVAAVAVRAEPPPPEVDDAERLRERLQILVSRLSRLAEEQVSRRSSVEERWIEDLRQFHGRYDPATEARLKAQGRSQLFVNLTRSKVNAWKARLVDMLFPTDDKNWGIKPTPVPELMAALHGEDREMKAAAEQRMAEAQRACEAMEREIEDQLREADYQSVTRDVIDDAVLLGTGVLKGPVTGIKMGRRWRAARGDAGQVIHVLETVPEETPAWVRVDPWNFFPDMSARTIQEAEFCFERHLLTASDVRKLARNPAFDRDALRRVVAQGSKESPPIYLQHLREITQTDVALDERFVVWEYRGPLDKEDILTICACTGDQDTLSALESDIDELDEIAVVVWFAGNELLSFGLHPLDSQDTLYSVFAFERDDTCVFGFGVPYLLRDQQRALNAAWRMMMDNAGLAAGPQIVVNRDLVAPADGTYTLAPWKVWYSKAAPHANQRPPFEVAHIQSNQAELANIIALAQRFMDDEANMPLVAQGEQSSHITQTAQGMAMLMNSANVVFRRVVKNFDDDLTRPSIRRAYDWLMQFSPKDEIKGDYQVDARGSSVLLVREVQAQNLMAMALQFSAHPVLGPLTKVPRLYRKLAQAHMLPADELIKTDDEIEMEMEQEKQREPLPDPEMMKLQAQLQIAQLKAETDIQRAMIERETQMMRVAAEQNISIEKLRADLRKTREEGERKERMMAAEMGVKARFGHGL